MYRQCRLVRTSTVDDPPVFLCDGVTRINVVEEIRVLWLPVQHAEMGMVLRLRDNGVWVDGWKVVSIGGSVLPEMVVTALNRAYLKLRKKLAVSDGGCF